MDTSGFLGLFDQRYDEYADELDSAASSLRSADRAIKVLPDMVGADGPRDYLLLFQNNAEIRATGGMPGSWARVHAEDGRLEMMEQGPSTEFPVAEEPVVPLTAEEVEVYGEEIGTLLPGSWLRTGLPTGRGDLGGALDKKFPDIELDGVLALDPVGMSYFLEGTGPIRVGSQTLTTSNVVDQLLNQALPRPRAEGAGRLLRGVGARDLRGRHRRPVVSGGLHRGFSTSRSRRPVPGGVVRSTQDEARLQGSRVLGELADDDGRDAARRHRAQRRHRLQDVLLPALLGRGRVAAPCDGDRQQLSARMSVNQTIPPAEAAQLPDSITGGGCYGTDPATRLVVDPHLRSGGGHDRRHLGRRHGRGRRSSRYVRVKPAGRDLDRPALVTSDDRGHHWTMESGPGQTGDGPGDLTPERGPGERTARLD